MSYSAALVPTHRPHAFEARGQQVALIFVEPESLEGRNLQRLFPNESIVALPSDVLEMPIFSLATAYEGRARDADLIALARTAVATLSGAALEPPTPPDARIARAVELVRQKLNDAISLSAIAAAVRLSPDRFRHLFMKQTGVGFRAYLLWQRLECSLAAYVAAVVLGSRIAAPQRRLGSDPPRRAGCRRPFDHDAPISMPACRCPRLSNSTELEF